MREFGQQSEQSEEAVSILNDALEKLESSLGKVYDEKVHLIFSKKILANLSWLALNFSNVT